MTNASRERRHGPASNARNPRRAQIAGSRAALLKSAARQKMKVESKGKTGMMACSMYSLKLFRLKLFQLKLFRLKLFERLATNRLKLVFTFLRPFLRSAQSASCAALLLAFSVEAAAQGGGWTAQGPGEPTPPSSGKPAALEKVSIEQRLNEQIPLDLMFRDENGETVRLGDYFGKKPVVLSLVYYSCPQLCNQVLNGLTGSLKTLSAFSIGKEFEVVTVSFDARETAELAAEKKNPYVNWYKRDGAAEGWHFLTGDQAAIDKLTEAVGFHYTYDPQTNQFAHASGIMIATPEGKLARYFYGIEYSAKDLRLGLVEASDNRIGSPVDQLLLYCYHYDPATGKYGPIVVNMIRLGGIVTIIGMIVLVFVLRRRGPGQDRASAGGVI